MNNKKLIEELEGALGKGYPESLYDDLIQFKRTIVAKHKNHPGLTADRVRAIDTVLSLIEELTN